MPDNEFIKKNKVEQAKEALRYLQLGERQAFEYRLFGYIFGGVAVIGIISLLAVAATYVTP
jgi:hypothetical protein